EPAETVEIRDAGAVLLRRLAEANARIDEDTAERNARSGGEPQGALEKALDIVEDVDGGVRPLAIVHDDDGRAGLGDDVGHGGVALQTPDIVDDRGAEAGGLPRHRRLHGVDRNGRVD